MHILILAAAAAFGLYHFIMNDPLALFTQEVCLECHEEIR